MYWLFVSDVAAVVAVLQRPNAECSAQMVKQTLGAIRSLTFDHTVNISALSEAGVCTGL